MPPDAPVIKTAGLVFDRLGLLIAVRVFEAERVMENWIMRGQAREGKQVALFVSREAYLANKDAGAFIPSCASCFTRYTSRGTCRQLVPSRSHGEKRRLLAAFEIPMVRSVAHLLIE
jgi:hypothetical protein